VSPNASFGGQQDRFGIRVVSRCNDGFFAGRLSEGDLHQSDRRTDYRFAISKHFAEKDLGADLNLAQKRAIEAVLAVAAQAGEKPDQGQLEDAWQCVKISRL
jgi:hypothetical protein